MPAEGQPCKQTSLRRAVWDLLCLLSPPSIHPWDLGRPVECGCWSRASGAVQLLLEPSWSAEAARGGAAPAPRRETGWRGRRLGSATSRVGGRVLLVGLPAPGCLPASCHHVSPRARPPGLAGGAGAGRRSSQVAGFGAAVQQLLTCEGSSWPHPSFCWPWSCSPCPALLFPWPLSALLSTSLCPQSCPGPGSHLSSCRASALLTSHHGHRPSPLPVPCSPLYVHSLVHFHLLALAYPVPF